jgi:hypothetical protein
MRLIQIACAAAAVAALLPATAQAKELTSARACGADDCRTISSAAALRGMDDGTPTAAPHGGAPFYRVRMTIGVDGHEEFRYTLAYVPSGGLLRVKRDTVGYDWMTATPAGRRAFDSLVRGLEPLPAAGLRGLAPAPVAPEPAAPAAPAVPDPGGPPWVLLLAGGALALAVLALALRRTAVLARGRHATAGQDGTPSAPPTAP